MQTQPVAAPEQGVDDGARPVACRDDGPAALQRVQLQQAVEQRSVEAGKRRPVQPRRQGGAGQGLLHRVA
ncbi:MAG: hypothetical protein M3Q10_10050, partial [Chloroflexota bacterium]|nr:hypothetical protein [Chloroflexota bacterium]